MSQSWEPNTIPKVVGGLNFPKSVIETKVDVLTFLEILVRKQIVTYEEIDEIREAVVAHLNVLYPELKLSYGTPAPLNEQAPLEAEKPAAAPLYAAAPPPNFI